MPTSTWNVSTSGSWGIAKDWLGGVPNSSTTDVLISIAGAYTVSLKAGQEYAVHDVTLNNATATLDIEGVLDLAGTLNLTSGHLHIDGAINGGTIATGGGNVTFDDCTLTGVTWEGALNIDAPLDSGPEAVNVAGGLTLTGANGVGAGSLSIEGSAHGYTDLNIMDTETLDNATLNFNGFNGVLLSSGSSSTPSVLTLGSNFVISQSGGENSLGDPNVDFGAIVNDGAIDVSAGTLADDAAFTNNGTITVSNAATFVFNSAVTLNPGSVLTTSGSGVFVVSYSAVLSGTVNASNANFEFKAGTLSGVTWEGALTIAIPATDDEAIIVNIVGGLTLTSASGVGPGSLNIDGSLAETIVNIEDSETLDNATLTFGGMNGYLGSGYVGSSTTPGILTFGENFIVSQSSATNYLESNAYAYKGKTYLDEIVNDGRINVSGGKLVDYGPLINNGAIIVSGGIFTISGTLPLGAGAFTNTGVITVDGGVLSVQYATFTNLSDGALTGGSYEVDAGSVIQLANNARILVDNADITLSGAGSSIQSLNYVNTQIEIDSTLTTISAAGTLSILGGRDFTTASTFTNNGILQVAGGVFTAAGLSNLSGGTLTGGTWIVGSGGALQLPNNAPVMTDDATIILTGVGSEIESLNTTGNQQVTIESSLTAIGASGVLEISGGRNYTAASTFTNSGALQITGGIFTASGLTNLSGETLTGGTWSVGAGGALQLPNNATVVTDDATIILTGAGSAIQSLNTASSRQVTIESTLTAIGASGMLEILGGRDYTTSANLVNSGLIELGGGVLTMSSLTDLAGSTLSGFGTVDCQFSGGSVTATGGALTFTGDGDAFSGAIGGTEVDLLGGTHGIEAGATVTTAALEMTGAAVYLDENLLYAGALTANPESVLVIAAGDTLTLTGTGVKNFGGSIAGAGDIIFAGGVSVFDHPALISTAGWTVTGPGVGVTLATALTYGGSFNALSGAKVTLNASKDEFTLTGEADFNGATVTGLGTLKTTGVTTIAGSFTIGNTLIWQNNGVVTASNGLILGNNAGRKVSLINSSTGIYDLTVDSGITLGGSKYSSFRNKGILKKTGGLGTSHIAVNFFSTGTVAAATGTIEFDGPINSFAGTVGGAGTLAFGGGGGSTLAAGLNLTVAALSIGGASTKVTLAGNIAYGGTFDQASGTTIALGANTLSLGGTSKLAGAIYSAGGGGLTLTAGTMTINAGFSLKAEGWSIADGVDILGHAGFTFAGALTDGASSLNLGGKSLTLTGADAFTGSTVDGSGALAARGTTSIDGLTLGGAAKLLNYGAAAQTGQVMTGDASGKTGSIANKASGVWNLTADIGIAPVAGGSGTFTNFGTLEKTAGSGISAIGLSLANDGVINAASGTLDLSGVVAGKGTMNIGKGATLELDAKAAATQTVAFGVGAETGNGGALKLTDAATFFSAISGFGAGDTLDLTGFAFGGAPKLSFIENATNTKGVLTVKDGAFTAAITLLGQYVNAGFGKAPDSGTGTLVTYTPPPGPGLELAVAHH
jgi:hypothetical protein